MFHNFFNKTHRKLHVSESHFYYSCRLGGGCNLIKEETPAQVFSCEFWDIFEKTSFKEHFQTTASIAIPWNTKLLGFFLSSNYTNDLLIFYFSWPMLLSYLFRMITIIQIHFDS